MSLPRGLILRFLILGTVLVVLGFIAARDAYLARTISYELKADALVIAGVGRSVRLPYQEMTRISFYRVAPAIRGPWTATLGRGRVGRFQVDGVGTAEVYSPDARRPLIVVERNLARYGLAPRDGETFYRLLLDRIPPRRARSAAIGRAD